MTTTAESTSFPASSAGTPLKVALWIAQLLIAVVFLMAGFMKFMSPIPELAKMIPWAGQLPTWFVRTMGLVDMAGGIGILLPALTRIKPNLTVAAAIGCTALQICAIAFHASRGEFNVLPLNFVLLPLALFVWWGRSKKARILPR